MLLFQVRVWSAHGGSSDAATNHRKRQEGRFLSRCRPISTLATSNVAVALSAQKGTIGTLFVLNFGAGPRTLEGGRGRDELVKWSYSTAGVTNVALQTTSRRTTKLPLSACPIVAGSPKPPTFPSHTLQHNTGLGRIHEVLRRPARDWSLDNADTRQELSRPVFDVVELHAGEGKRMFASGSAGMDNLDGGVELDIHDAGDAFPLRRTRQGFLTSKIQHHQVHVPPTPPPDPSLVENDCLERVGGRTLSCLSTTLCAPSLSSNTSSNTSLQTDAE
ncbi:hypothetical protein CYLTODRAFT_446303 [Cylindrobasidium torrendii FP15055 ss-10]|uniref:Uncharacterized protein n=1 Tax=Cylindrobasidium torrendii FP15055 ss-10 TaxID=1314674 RepID=A0A0D7AZZ7_9AGAR|nr:hypothetical protein CYLTODRAFT_446303 [Cylindrobasidium torrendii FP15055 ss-10]